MDLRSAKNARFKIKNARSETRVFITQCCVYCSLVLDSVWLRAKDAHAENPLVNNGMQENAETACVLGCVVKTQLLAFWPI